MGSRLYVEVGADVKNAVRGLNTISRQLSGLGDQARGVRNIAIGVTGVIAVKRALGGLYDLTRAAQDEAAGQARLQRAIANTGRVVDTELVGSLENWVSAQENATGFADDQVRSSLAVLVAQTGDLAEAQRRSALAADLATGFDMDLVTASKLLGKVTDENIGSLRRLGIDLPDVGAGYTEAAAQADTAADLAQKAGISFEGAMKLVKSGGAAGESVLKRYGVAMRKAAKGTEISADDVMSAVEKAVGGQAKDRMAALGPGAQLANDWQNLREQVGAFFVPIFAKGAALALKGIRGLRRAVSLFTTDLSGPKIGSARKVWKAVFGTEMPAALGVVVDSFGKIATRITTFVDDLNSTDDNTVRGAIKKLFEGLKTDITAGLAKLGEELDKQGAVGLGIKVLIGAFTFGVANAATIGVAEKVFGILKDALTIAWMSVALLGSGPVLAIAAGVTLGIMAIVAADYVTEAWKTAEGIYRIVKDALVGVGIGLAAVGAMSGFPIVAAIGVGVLLGVGAVSIAESTGPTGLGDLYEKVLGFLVSSLPFPAQLIAKVLHIKVPVTVDWIFGGSPPPAVPAAPKVAPGPSTGPVPNPKVNPGRNPYANPDDRLATLDDIYAAYTNNHGVMPDWEWAKNVLSMGPMWSEVQGLAKGGIVPPTPGGTLARIGEGGQAEMVLPLNSAREMGFGGGGGLSIGQITIQGNVDSEARVQQVSREIGRETYRVARALGLAS